MDKQFWLKHLTSWKQFLKERIASAGDIGDKVKIERQLRTIERVRCGAVLNPLLLMNFIDPTTQISQETICDEYFFDLNESQKKAVRLSLGNNNLSLIQGPPGTGKTQVIAEICLQLYKQNPDIKILVCSETHSAVNNLLSRIAECKFPLRIVRIRDKENDDSVDCFSPEEIIKYYLNWAAISIKEPDVLNVLENELTNVEDRSLEKTLALSSNITGMTCNRTAAYNFIDSTEMFDVVVIDEVCKATLPEILAPLLISKKAILLGDPKQLSPIFCSEEREIIQSIENCDLAKYMYINDLFSRTKSTTFLDTQYRMSNQIGNMISQVFYDSTLKNGRNKNVEKSLIWINYNTTKEWPLPHSNNDRPEIYNMDECKIINRLLEHILLLNEQSTSIAVIAPYRAQIRMLRECCVKSTQVKIDTVDSFQGKEADIVIFSVTRTKGSKQFFSDPRRLNVALSRARNQVYIIGNINYCQNSPLLNEIEKMCETIEWDENFTQL